MFPGPAVRPSPPSEGHPPCPPTPPPTSIRRLLDPDCPPFALLHRRTPGRPGGRRRGADRPGRRASNGWPTSRCPTACRRRPGARRARPGPVPADPRTRLRRPRRRHPAARAAPGGVATTLPLDRAAAAAARARRPGRGGALRRRTTSAYAGVVRRVIEDEIGRGEGANFVIRRTFRGAIAGFGPGATRWPCSRRLLPASAAPTGRSWCTPASAPWSAPARRCTCGCRGGTVVMNPISGTYRYPAEGPDADGAAGVPARPQGGARS